MIDAGGLEESTIAEFDLETRRNEESLAGKRYASCEAAGRQVYVKRRKIVMKAATVAMVSMLLALGSAPVRADEERQNGQDE